MKKAENGREKKVGRLGREGKGGGRVDWLLWQSLSAERSTRGETKIEIIMAATKGDT
jgi:hypothetical protein